MSINGFILSDKGTINAVVNGKAYSIPHDHINYSQIKRALLEDNADLFCEMAEVTRAFDTYSAGRISVKDGEVYFLGKVVDNVIAQRIKDMMRAGYPFEPMLLFLSNLMENPSHQSIKELYKFLEHKDLPITEDGHFLAYKSVTQNYKDHHTQTFDNRVGQRISCPRNEVDDNRKHACSNGFHAGSMKYVASFDRGSPIVIVKINPRDVVSIPYDSNETKCRICEYLVIDEYKGDLNDLVYSAEVDKVNKVQTNTVGGYTDTYRSDDDVFCEDPDSPWHNDEHRLYR